MDGDDAGQVVRVLDHHRAEAVALGDHLGHVLDDRLVFARLSGR